MWLRAVVAGLIVLLAVGTGTIGATTGGPTTAATTTVHTPGDNGTDATTSQIMQVRVLSDGSANWTVVTRVSLDGANETAAFETVAAAFERGEVGPSASTFRRAAAAASDATGREMNITNVSRATRLFRYNRTGSVPASENKTIDINTTTGVETTINASTVTRSAEATAVDTTTALTITTGPNETTGGLTTAGPNDTTRLGDTTEPNNTTGLDTTTAGVGFETTAETVSQRANRTRAVGLFALSFRWRGFANETGGLLRVGDVFNTPDGTWLPGLAANQTLVIAKPSGYDYYQAPIGPVQGALRWSGPVEFLPGSPSAVYVQQGVANPLLPNGRVPTGGVPFPDIGSSPNDTTTSKPASSNGTPANDTPANGSLPGASSPTGSPGTTPATNASFPSAVGDSLPTLLGIGVLALLVLAGVGFVLWRRRGASHRPGVADSDPGSRLEESSSSEGTTHSGGAGDGADPGGGRSDGTPGSSGRARPTNGEPTAEEATADGEPTAGGALLTDEERVERLLEQNDGRLRQAEIVTRTDWSNAKASQLLSGMAEAGRVEKLRIGRENLISLPGRGVEDASDSRNESDLGGGIGPENETDSEDGTDGRGA